MDRTDLRILQLLQADGRLSTVELADKVGLSPSPCARRLKRLEDQGTISGYRAILDRNQLALSTTVFVSVRLSHHQEEVVQAFENAMMTMSEVISCHVVSGAFDYLLEVVARDLSDYEGLVRKLRVLPMVHDINSSFAIRTVKDRFPLPLAVEEVKQSRAGEHALRKRIYA